MSMITSGLFFQRFSTLHVPGFAEKLSLAKNSLSLAKISLGLETKSFSLEKIPIIQ